MTNGQQLKKLLTDIGWKQNQLATHIGTTEAVISGWIHDNEPNSLALSVTIKYLMLTHKVLNGA